MATTIKTVLFSAGEDIYRKKKMVARLEERGLLSAASKSFILKGRR